MADDEASIVGVVHRIGGHLRELPDGLVAGIEVGDGVVKIPQQATHAGDALLRSEQTPVCGRPGNLAGDVLQHLAALVVDTEDLRCPGEPALFHVP